MSQVAYETYYACDAVIEGQPCGARIEFNDVDGEPDSSGSMRGSVGRQGEDGAIRCLGCEEDVCRHHAAPGTPYCLDCRVTHDEAAQVRLNLVFCGGLGAVALASAILFFQVGGVQ